MGIKIKKKIKFKVFKSNTLVTGNIRKYILLIVT